MHCGAVNGDGGQHDAGHLKQIAFCPINIKVNFRRVNQGHAIHPLWHEASGASFTSSYPNDFSLDQLQPFWGVF